MSWRLVVRPDVGKDLGDAADWYESRSEGLGNRFIEEVFHVLDSIQADPFLNSRRHPSRNIRWRYPASFPYRIIYEVMEAERIVVIAAILHAARHDRRWKKRL